MAFSSDGKLLISAASTPDGSSQLFNWNLTDGNRLETVLREFDAVSLAMAPDDRAVYVASGSGLIIKFKIENRAISEVLARLNQRDPVHFVAHHPSVDMIAVAHGNHVSFWKQGEETPLGFVQDTPITSLAFSRDGKLLLIACFDGTARVWNVGSRRNAAVFAPQAPGSTIGLPIFSADGNQIITAGSEGIIRFWDVRSFRNSDLPGR